MKIRFIKVHEFVTGALRATGSVRDDGSLHFERVERKIPAGEVLRFPEAEARRLIASGIAEPVAP